MIKEDVSYAKEQYNFVNLQESPAGFGKTNEEAFEDLKRNWDEIKQLIKEQ